MARYTGPACKLCRREGTKLFLKGTRCLTEKCAVERRAYAPGQHGQSSGRRRKASDYQRQLREKQKVKRIYGLSERQFRNIFDTVLKEPGVTGEALLVALESRLDNLVYRMGFAVSRRQARQLVRHRHVQVNGRTVDIPSYRGRPGDEVKIVEASRELALVKHALEQFGRQQPVSWIQVDTDKVLGKLTQRDDNPNAAEFRLQPLERGYGYTLGNSLRRMLLSSLRGAAVWAFRLEGVVHEHQTIPGVVEDVHQIIQRLKQLTLVLAPDVDEAVMHIKHDKAGPVYARDIEAHSAVTIVNPDQLLFTLQDDREIGGELYVNKGRGYVEAEQHPIDRTMPVDVVRVDSIYNPVRRANFTVAETRVGQRTDYDRLTLTVETNGTISPEDAVAYAAALAQEHFRFFVDFGKVPMVAAQPAGNGGAATSRLREVLARSIDDVGLSVRSVNSLKNSNIRTLGDLVQYREEDLLKVKNVGEKALGEIAELLRREGLNFGMKFEETEDELKVVDAGAAPQAQVSEGDAE